MKANPLQDKSWSSLELVVQTRQERETKLSFAYEWTFSSYSMAASERLKTSRKAVTGAKKQLVIFAWPGVQIYWTNGCKSKKNRLYWRENMTIYTSEHTVLYLFVREYWKYQTAGKGLLQWLHQKVFVAKIFTKTNFLIQSAHCFFVHAVSFVASWKRAVSQDPHNQDYKC